MKNSDKVYTITLKDSSTTKLGWKETYSETWCEQIMLSTPQKFSASDTCFTKINELPQKFSASDTCFTKAKELRYTRFLISNGFFNSASVLLNFLMNWASYVA